ncbi:hypothetical protein V1264_002139 [Littorina saxatilis]|uniref:Cytochrome P450 n=1 Tax=Littorina saxatilis TaxID=31220 RepID=A0AAN9GPX8_9CAEN
MPTAKYPVEQFGHMINGLHEAHGPIYRLKISKVWQVNIDRVEDAEIAFRKEEDAPYRTPLLIEQIYNQRAKSPVNFVGITNGSHWRRVRSSLNVLMNRPRSVTHYLSAQEQVAVDFADRLYREQGSDPAVVTDLFFRFATESVGVVCFNKRLGFLDEDSRTDAQKAKLLWSYRTNTRCVSEAMFGRRILYRLYEDSFYREYKEAKETIVEHARQCIAEAREETTQREKEGTLDPDEANFLLSLVTEKSLTEQDVFDVVFSLMAAGSDTTSCTLQLLFYALATNPDKQEKVAEEVLTHMGRDGPLTAPVLDKLAYMTAAVREGMRLYFPVASSGERFSQHNTALCGYQVPKGTRLILNSLGNATCPRYFDNPESFSPERWLRNKEGRREKDIHPLAHLPFGVGRRNCIGRRFALQELYLAATKTLQKYRIGLKEGCPPLETIFTPVRVPKHHLPFTLTPRD